MYDTFNSWLKEERAGEPHLLEQVPIQLTGVTEYRREEQDYVSGHLKNFKVYISAHGISLKGSLGKYYLNDNFKTLNREDSKMAIEKLSDEIHLPIRRAKVTRLDFAANFSVKHPPETYYNYLGACTHYQRLVQPSSLYYTNGLRILHFYNKIAEAKNKRIPIPQMWSGENVLRYELRFISRLSHQFNVQEITADRLYDATFYNSLLDRWEHEYLAIHKNKNYTPKIIQPMTAAESRDILLALLASQQPDEVMLMIEEWHKQNVFSSDREYYRAKQEIRKLIKKLPEGQNELITELDEKVKAAKQLYS